LLIAARCGICPHEADHPQITPLLCFGPSTIDGVTWNSLNYMLVKNKTAFHLTSFNREYATFLGPCQQLPGLLMACGQLPSLA